MKRRFKRSLWLGALAALACCASAQAQSIAPHEDALTWESLAAGHPADVDGARWQHVVEQLKGNGFSVESARQCLLLARKTERLGLPTDPVLSRIEEGVAKRVDAQALEEAARRRLLRLQQAAAMLAPAGYGDRNAPFDRLMKSVALALESGLSAETLQPVLARGKGGQCERIRCIVESGEMMLLNGMDESIVGQVMNDCAERNMRRMEVMRASRFALQQHRARMDGARIRQQLWNGTRTGEAWHQGPNAAGAVGPGPRAGRPADRGNGPASSGASSGQGGRSSASPGQSGPSGGPQNSPADAGDGGRGDRGQAHESGHASSQPRGK